MPEPLTLYSIGHSTRTAEELIALLREHGVVRLADVRRFPASRRHPQFNREALAVLLAGAGLEYRHFEDLGGRRSRRPDSPHTAWRVAGFRGYADYTDTAPFRAALDELIAWGRGAATAFMCAEAWYVQCHRRLIADRLVVRGMRVVHIVAPGRSEEHRLPAFARVTPEGGIVYDGGELRLDFPGG